MKKIPGISLFALLLLVSLLSGCTSQSPSPIIPNNSLKTYDSPPYGISFGYPGEWIVTTNETVLETRQYNPMKILRLEHTNSSSGLSFIITADHSRLPPHEGSIDSEDCGGGWTDDRDNLTVLESYNETLIGDGIRARRFVFTIDNPEGKTIETLYEICRSNKSGTRTHYWIFWSVPSENFFIIQPEIQKVLDSIRITEPIPSNTTPPADVQTATLSQPVTCNPPSCLPPSGNYRPQPPFEGDTPLFSSDISDVISYLGPDGKIPAWLPEGYVFSSGGLWEIERDGRHVLQYESEHGSIFIVYSYHPDWYYWTFLPGEPKTGCINGTEIMIFTENSSRQVRWCDGKIIRWITAPLSEEEILRIAESLGPPDVVDLTSSIYTQKQNISLMIPLPHGPLENMTFPATPTVHSVSVSPE